MPFKQMEQISLFLRGIRTLGVQEFETKRYLTGPSAKNYLDVRLFEAAGIEVTYPDYNYPEYPQLYGNFEPNLSILDLLFNTGSEAGQYIWPEQTD